MLWGGAFSEPSDSDLRSLQDSISFDKRFYKQDIWGSIGYARAIAAAGILSASESEAIIESLKKILAEFDAGEFEFKDGDEDIHTAVERRLIEIVGPAGGKLHTGRSRNDQVATDFRLWVLDAIAQVDAQLASLQSALIEKGELHIETLMPGYTHLQPAQPITAGHWLMSFFWMLTRDRERLLDSARRTSVSPLGSGALAGTPFDIDRAMLASHLGFQSLTQNSLDGVSDRDFVAEFLFNLSLLGTHLSRLAEDIIIYSNPLFGYITLNDRYSTGSSIMPQKRNADPMELARGKAGRLIGNLTGLLVVLKGIPSSYDKDLQEDKEAVFDSVDNVLLLLPVVTAIIKTLHLNADKMQSALGGDMLATDLAEYLVRKGLPFRNAHHISGQAVRLAASRGGDITMLSYEDFRGLSNLFEEDVMNVFDFRASVAKRNALGGTAPEAVRIQIVAARNWLRAHKGVHPVQRE